MLLCVCVCVLQWTGGVSVGNALLWCHWLSQAAWHLDPGWSWLETIMEQSYLSLSLSLSLTVHRMAGRLSSPADVSSSYWGGSLSHCNSFPVKPYLSPSLLFSLPPSDRIHHHQIVTNHALLSVIDSLRQHTHTRVEGLWVWNADILPSMHTHTQTYQGNYYVQLYFLMVASVPY